MEIFNDTTTGYSPLIPNLEGYWDRPFESLPEALKPLVKRGFFTFPWNGLDAESRRDIAFQYDCQHDPNHEPVTIYQLALLADKLQDQLDDERKKHNEANDTKIVLIRDFLDDINRIIDTDREHVGAEIQQLKMLSQSCAGPENFSDSEKGTLLKLVLGMAVSAYHYDPGSNRNAATGTNRGSISADLARIRLSVCNDTVRKYLDEAKDEYGYLIPKPDDC